MLGSAAAYADNGDDADAKNITNHDNTDEVDSAAWPGGKKKQK